MSNTQPQPPKKAPLLEMAEQNRAQIAAQQTAAQPAKPARRGLALDIQRLAKLDRLLSEMDPDEAVRALEWAEGKYGAEARFEALRVQESANGEAR